MPAAPSPAAPANGPRLSLVRTVLLLALFAAFACAEAFRCSSLSGLDNGDTWWHLSSGLWMLQHRALARGPLFSQAATSLWASTSWIYDLKLAVYFELIGLKALPLFAAGSKIGLAIVTFLLAGGRRTNFWLAIALSLAAQYIVNAFEPVPSYPSILLFSVELLLLLSIRSEPIDPGLSAKAPQRSRFAKPTFWLPFLFLLWANLDPSFVYGLAVLILFLILARSGAPLHELAPSIALSVLATFLTPGVFRPYGVFFSNSFSASAGVLPEYHAPGFRRPEDYVLLLLVMSAFLALGLRRSRDLFLLALVSVSAALSFHAQRDTWLVVLAAVAVIGQSLREAKAGRASFAATHMRELLISAAASLVVLVLIAAFAVPAPPALLAKAARTYPVAAADYIRDRRLPQPLFNAFEWGGFLTWYLPEYPVAIDSRLELYGDDFIVQYSKMMNAEIPYTEFPALANARTILLPRASIMAQALATLPAYKVAYSDDVATVLTREDP